MDYNSNPQLYHDTGPPCGGGHPPRRIPTAAQLRRYVCLRWPNGRSRRTFLPTPKKPCSAPTAATTAWCITCWTLWTRIGICTVGVNMGFGGLIYGASEMKKQADVDGKPFCLDHGRPLRRPGPPGAGSPRPPRKRAALSGCWMPLRATLPRSCQPGKGVPASVRSACWPRRKP